uniref:Calponin-homology (CH) domain-containing protein n=1 Tax=Takifugu rubripes TaxID=31033 RepID=A0A674MCX1_TAKRU
MAGVDKKATWFLQTFSLSAPCSSAEELTTGAAISQALHQIDPAWFSESWLSRIKTDVEENWRLKVLSSLFLSYYWICLPFISPDVALVAEHAEPTELGRLLQLVLGCAVNCERKQEYIQIIMTLEEAVQHVVMTAIQELMSKESVAQSGAEPSGDLEHQLKKALEDLAELLAEKEEFSQRCQELDRQVALLHEERNSLLAENDVLTDRANQLDTFEDPSTPSGRKHSHLQQQVESLQEETFRLEAAKDDYRIHCEDLEKQLIEVQHRNDELTSLAEESRALKDELDVLRNCSDQVVMLEASVETYKRKLENLGDLKRQMRLLEENNMTYMQNTVGLEEELRKANAARAQLETYKRQVQELHKKMTEETRRADNLAFEMKKLEEKHETVLKEKERIIMERESLKEINEELRCSQAQQHQLSQAGTSRNNQFHHDNLAAELIPIEYREKFLRLQHENKMLRVQQEECEREKIAALEAQLEEAHKAQSELDTENRLKQERVGELQRQVEDLQKALQSQAVKPDESNLKKKLDAHKYKLWACTQDEIMKKKELLEDLQHDSSLKVDELMAALKKKDDDMRAMEERYKMYLEKARNVSELLQRFRVREYEEKMIVTAWYNKSLNFQKLAMESRLGGCPPAGPTQSFLSQQRQVANTPRRGLSVNTSATTSQ